jgi:hypothetical protein
MEELKPGLQGRPAGQHPGSSTQKEQKKRQKMRFSISLKSKSLSIYKSEFNSKWEDQVLFLLCGWMVHLRV